jgi:drug/metabolite transporter (DMT)-like permease
MSLSSHLLAVLCASMIAAGQVLFKLTADAIRLTGTPWHAAPLMTAALALAIYGLATLLWIMLLQHVPLSRAYPYMALSFVLVAAASALLLGERIGVGQMAGFGLIVAGFLVVARS